MVESTGFESRRMYITYRGFESHPILFRFILLGFINSYLKYFMSDNLFFYHIKELKYRLYYILTSFIMSMCFCIYNWESILYFFIKIFNESDDIQKYIILNDFIYTGVMDIFFNMVIFSLLIGILINIPLILFHIISFFITGSYLYEIKMYIKVIMVSLILFYIFLFFTYNYILPSMYLFFIKMNSLDNSNLFNFNFEVHINDIINFIYKTTLFSSIISQLPIFMYLLHFWNFYTSYSLYKHKNIFVFFIFCIISLIIPLDFFNAFLIYLCIFILYEISLFIITFIEINEKYIYEKQQNT